MSEKEKEKQEKSSRFGIIVLLAKLGSKLAGPIGKLFVTLKLGKVGLAVASLGAYAFLFTWQFAVALCIMLFVHEYGHVWAMKRRGMKVKGMYFIPLLGAVAVPDEAFPTRKDEIYTALMGPLWGLGCSVAFAGVYFITHNPIFAGIASMLALINLFNLIPINPLDGGRAVKSIAFSFHTWVGFGLVALGFVISIFMTYVFGYYLLLLFCVIGLVDVMLDFRHRKDYKNLTRTEMGIWTLCYVGLAVGLLVLMNVMAHEPGAVAAIRFLKG